MSSQPPTKRRRKITVERLRSLREGTEVCITDQDGLNSERAIVQFSLREHTYLRRTSDGHIFPFDPYAMRVYLRHRP